MRPARLPRLVALFLSIALAPVTVAADAGPCAGLDPVLAGSSFVLLVEPAAGARIASGATVVGCSRTLDGQVAWHLVGQSGAELASGAATGGGVNGPGELRFVLRYDVERPERGHLELFAPRHTDEGPPPPATRIPLVLAPGAPDLPLFGRFAGDLPCADCAGIRTELTLYGDLGAGERRFALRETYLGPVDGGRPRETRGQWTPRRGDGEVAMLLELVDLDGTVRRFEVAGRDLRMLDRDGRRIDSRLNYTLARQPTAP